MLEVVVRRLAQCWMPLKAITTVITPLGFFLPMLDTLPHPKHPHLHRYQDNNSIAIETCPNQDQVQQAVAQRQQQQSPTPSQPNRSMPRGEALIVYGGAETESDEDEPPNRRALLRKVLRLPRTSTEDVITLE